ncbi:MAG: hypothetical protein AAGA87_10770 [Pseudomonadota bacterium]
MCRRRSCVGVWGSELKIGLVACAQYPGLSLSNLALRDSLQRLGAEVSVPVWNRDPYEMFLGNDLNVLRQTWDYQDDPAGYAAWFVRLEELGGRVIASARQALWNNDKRTLVEVAGPDLAIPATVSLRDPIDPGQIADIPGEQIVLKPAVGGSGVGVERCARADLLEGVAAARREAPGRPMIAQEFLPEIAEGEWKMTCIKGRVVQAVRAVPKGDAFRINSRFQPDIQRMDPPAAALASAESVLARLGAPVYARVDGVMRAGTFVCTELELTDPDLYLHLDRAVSDRLAEAILAEAH